MILNFIRALLLIATTAIINGIATSSSIPSDFCMNEQYTDWFTVAKVAISNK